MTWGILHCHRRRGLFWFGVPPLGGQGGRKSKSRLKAELQTVTLPGCACANMQRAENVCALKLAENCLMLLARWIYPQAAC